MSNLLPQDFAALEPFAGWALTTETERNRKRVSSAQADITAFADAMLPHVDAITAYLDGPPSATRNEVEDERLMCMLLSLAEVAPAIEAYRQPTVVDGYVSSRFAPMEGFRLRPRL